MKDMTYRPDESPCSLQSDLERLSYRSLGRLKPGSIHLGCSGRILTGINSSHQVLPILRIKGNQEQLRLFVDVAVKGAAGAIHRDLASVLGKSLGLISNIAPENRNASAPSA